MAICQVEKCVKETRNNSKHCSRHAEQLRKYGKIVSDKPSYRDLNEIRILENHAEIVLRNKNGDDIAISIIDIESVDCVKSIKWYLTDHGYCATRGKNISGYLHRFIVPDSNQVDHINGNRLDNRKCNLRQCNQSQNNANTNARKNSKTGTKGVVQVKSGKFRSQITCNGEKITIGTFDTIEEAKNAYDKKAVELFDCFARVD